MTADTAVPERPDVEGIERRCGDLRALCAHPPGFQHLHFEVEARPIRADLARAVPALIAYIRHLESEIEDVRRDRAFWVAAAFIALLLHAVFAFPAHSAELPARVLRCYDGDTCTVAAPGLRAAVAPFRGADRCLADMRSDRATVRLYAPDTPEIGHRAACWSEERAGIGARTFTRRFVRDGAVTVEVVGCDTVYRRPLVNLRVDGRDLGEALVAARLGRDCGGPRCRNWCEAGRPGR